MPHILPLATLALRAALWPPWGSSPTSTSSSIIPTSTAEPKTAWVTVDKTGGAQTVTPVTKTHSGALTTISEIPYQLTGTIFTTTVHLEISTSTGRPVPTANKKGEGSFLACQNPDPDNKPFCLPKRNATVYDGISYFVTWDPTYFNGTESKIRVKGFYNINADDDDEEEAFSSEEIDPGRGFYRWKFKKDLFLAKSTSNTDPGAALNLQIELPVNETETAMIPGPTVHLRPKPQKPIHQTSHPSGKALYIGLPVFFGSLLLMVILVSFCNRKARRIGIGNVMSRSRRLVGKTRSKRFGNRDRKGNKEQAIPLMDRDSDEYTYRERDRQSW